MSFRIPWAAPTFSEREKQHVLAALESTWISGGPYVDRFEREFNAMHGCDGLAVSNGTTALQLALIALGIAPGDEVIVPGFTFVAPGNMVIACGATPVFVDVDARTWCIDVAAVERAITSRTKAVIAVHVYGNVCDLERLRSLCDSRGLSLVEDVAEAAFSRYRGRPAGTFGDLGCFSFQATKTITMGEGGFVLARRRELAEKMRVVRDHGMRRGKRYWHDEVGYNFRVTNLQAALGCAQLERLDEILRARARVYATYRRLLEREPGVELQRMTEGVEPVVWAVALRLDPARFTIGRDAVIAALAEQGIETRPGFYPFSVMPLYRSPRLPVAEEIGAQVISVPTYPALSDDNIQDVCQRLLALRGE